MSLNNSNLKAYMFYISEIESWKKLYNDHFDNLNPNCPNVEVVEFANSLKFSHELEQQTALNTCQFYLKIFELLLVPI